MKLTWQQEELLKEMFRRELHPNEKGFLAGWPKEIVSPLIKAGYINQDHYRFAGICRMTEKGMALIGNAGL